MHTIERVTIYSSVTVENTPVGVTAAAYVGAAAVWRGGHGQEGGPGGWGGWKEWLGGLLVGKSRALVWRAYEAAVM